MCTRILCTVDVDVIKAVFMNIRAGTAAIAVLLRWYDAIYVCCNWSFCFQNIQLADCVASGALPSELVTIMKSIRPSGLGAGL
jgi:hypothetical protein